MGKGYPSLVLPLSLPDKHEYRLGVAGGYPLLDERKVVIQSNGIVSAIDLFDREHDEVYFDNCCHYTLKGINLMVQFVAEQVARRLN